MIDKRHVQRRPNDALEGARKALRADLPSARRRRLLHDGCVLLTGRRDLRMGRSIVPEAWTDEFPVLKVACEAKESFFAVWETVAVRGDARAIHRAWEARLPEAVRPAFKSLVTAMRNCGIRSSPASASRPGPRTPTWRRRTGR